LQPTEEPELPHLKKIAAAAAVIEDEKPAWSISPEKTQLFEQVANCWSVVVPAGTTAAELHLRPEPFDLIAGMPLTKGDSIRAWTSDEKAIFDLVVVRVSAGRAWCMLRQELQIRLPDDVPGSLGHVPEGYEIVAATMGDTQLGWLIRRTADGVLLNGAQAPILDHQEALRFLLNHPSVRGQKPLPVQRATLT
jgi:hypothetical protein